MLENKMEQTMAQDAVSQSARHRDQRGKYPVSRTWDLSMKYLMQKGWNV